MSGLITLSNNTLSTIPKSSTGLNGNDFNQFCLYLAKPSIDPIDCQCYLCERCQHKGISHLHQRITFVRRKLNYYSILIK